MKGKYRRLRQKIGGRLPLAQSGSEVTDQIVRIFDAARETDQGVVDTELLAHVVCDRGVRHQRGMLDQALHAAETLGQREQAAALQKAPRVLEAAVKLAGDHAAEGVHL